MAKIACPACKSQLKIEDKDLRQGFMLWCTECGQKIVLEKKQGAGSVVFPTFGSDETLLDLGDTGAFEKPKD